MNAIELLARGGYAARGVVYAIVGFFAVLAAFGSGAAKDQQQALFTILDQPFGTTLLGVVVIGLFGFALWRFVQAALDTDDHGRGAKGLAVRTGLMVAGFTYAALAVSTGTVLIGSGSGSSGDSGNGFIQGAVGFFGSTIVAGALAIIFLAVAGAHVVKAWTGRFERFFRCDEDRMRIVRITGKVGLTARGIVFLILAVLMGYRAFVAGSGSAQPPNLREVLLAVQDLPAGWLLLALIGAGLVAFAAYSFAAAMYRTIDRRSLSPASVRDRLVGGLSPLTPEPRRRP